MLDLLTRAAPPLDDTFMRAAELRPNSFDPATRRFVAVLATSFPVRRAAGYTEILDPAGANLPASLPLVLDHRSETSATVGRASNLRREDNAIVADCSLSRDASLDWLASRIEDGTLSGISIAYTVSQWAEGRDASGQRQRTASRWTPRHAAIVSEPADALAGIRSAEPGGAVVTTRSRRIRNLSRALGLDRAFEDQAIDSDWSDEEFNQRAADRLAARANPISATRHNDTTLDNPEVLHRASVESLVARISGSAPQGAARELAGLSWPEFHRRYLRARGQSVAGLSDHEVIVRALSTSDLPLLTGDALNISLRRDYEAAQSPIMAVAAPRERADFRLWTEAMADWTTLTIGKVNELGEYKSSYVTESGEQYRLYTIGGITAISRQVYVNGPAAIRNLSLAQGRRLAADVADRMIAFITQGSGAGPAMRDTNPVFFAARANIADLDTTDITPVIAGVLAARAAAAKRKGAGDVIIGVAPRFWVVAPEFEATAIRALATISATQAADVNPLTGRLEIVTEPRLADPDVSYLVAAPAMMDGLVRIGLTGAPGPMTETRWGFEVDALQFKIRLDVGHGFVDWRGWTRLDHAAVPAG